MKVWIITRNQEHFPITPQEYSDKFRRVYLDKNTADAYSNFLSRMWKEELKVEEKYLVNS